MTNEIAAVRALREAGQHDLHLQAACDLAARLPGEAGAQIEAAYALDRAGFEHSAIVHYDEAFRLGVPVEERRHFMIGYGSTMRNVGRVDEAIALFEQAIATDPGYSAYHAFLALALESSGHARAALARLLACMLDCARPGAFDGYERALAEYGKDLMK